MSKDAAKSNKEKKHFWKDFRAELKKVIWPTPKQVVNNTVAVITIVVITAAIVFVLDLAFDLFNKYGINNLKSRIRGNEIVQVEEEHTHDHDHDHDHENEVVENTVSNVVVEENNAIENQTVSE